MSSTPTESSVCVGIDFDNTLVCYDAVFARVAAEQGLAGAAAGPGTARRLLRETLRRAGEGELTWTRIQGEVYGPGMRDAQPFAGSLDVIRGWLSRGWRVVIISHRTRFAAAGPAHDLHAHARAWIDRWLNDERVTAWFETTRWAKLRRIQSEGCTVFVDDLLEVLEDPAFPSAVRGIHFSPDAGACGVHDNARTTVSDWTDLPGVVARLSGTGVAVSSGATGTVRLDPFPADPILRFEELVARDLHARIADAEWLRGGINNLCARLRLHDGRTIVGKCYRRSPQDPRDRYLHETAFLRLLERVGIECVPRVLSVDEANGISLQTHLSGESFPEDGVASPDIWQQFDAFLARLQDAAVRHEAQDLPLAAEAGLSLQDHLGWLQQRRDLWRARALAGDLAPELTERITGELEDAYARVAHATISHPEFKFRIETSRLILTPSDFGLHNALVDGSGRVGFVDFEYAGWDDPAKTEIDFCLQPRHAIGRPGRLACLDARLDRGSDRFRALRDLLELKWRYIVLAAQFSASIARSPSDRCPVQQ